jgi:Spy/CpxP family protein refolding chaperone
VSGARALGGATLVALLATTAVAQTPPDGPKGPGRPREEAGRMIDAYVISNLQESLGLTDDQFVKLLPLVKHLQAERREAMQKRAHALGEIRRLLKSGSATEAQVVDQLKALKAVDSDGGAQARKSMDSIDAALSPLQQAKFRVFEAEVGQKLR